MDNIDKYIDILEEPALTLFISLTNLAKNHIEIWTSMPQSFEYLTELGLTFTELQESVKILEDMGICIFDNSSKKFLIKSAERTTLSA